MNISYGSAFVIIHDDLSYLKICARWVPQQPMQKHIQTLLWIVQDFLQRHSQEGEGLLQGIVTGDKHGLNIISQTIIDRVWSGNTPHVQTQTEIPTSHLCRQSDAALVWICNGPILVQYFSARHYSRIIHHNTEIKAEADDLQQAQRFAVKRWFFWSMIKHICILRQLLLNQSGS